MGERIIVSREPKYTLEQASPELVRWYRDSRGWADVIRSGEYRDYYRTPYGNR